MITTNPWHPRFVPWVPFDEPTGVHMEENKWIKSTFSGEASCVEVFRKSSFSGSGGSCVEVADLEDGGAAIRDTKLGDASPVLKFTKAEWEAFGKGFMAGEFGTF